MQRADPSAPVLVAGFLTPDECRELVCEIDAAQQAQAEIWGDGGFEVHPDSRRGLVAELSVSTEILVQDRLWDVIPELEQQFGCEVSHVSGVTALVYRRGDHFAAHSDGGGDDAAPDELRRRRVSLVIALNNGASDFSGGALEFFESALPQDAARCEPLARVCSRPGLLVAFASNTIHRVVPVVDGRRYSLALWALAV